MQSLLAINWQPEIRGVLTVIIGVAVFMGSTYLLLLTNLGARLGFLVTLTGLAGWMALMGLAWTIYGIGLKGPEPSWKPVPGRTVLQDPQALVRAGVLETPVEIPEDATPPEIAEIIKQQFQDERWTPLAESDSAFGQAASEAGVLVEETEAFSAGEYQVVNVFDIGGERYPKINESLDFLAFFHKPHYVVVEVAPLVPTRTEPGRAPASPEIDETRSSQYVYMVRDLGARRQPAIVLFTGSTIILLTCAWLLHRRDALVERNREAAPAAAG
jgi:hypothetical protein